jgi:hypothetical protein
MTDINTYLESLKTKLEEVIVDFQSKYNTLPQGEVQLLANINAILNPGGSSGGGGDATNAGTKTAIETATNLDGIEGSLGGINGLTEGISDNLGLLSDSAALSDTGNFNLIQFVKRLLSVKLPDSVSGRIPVNAETSNNFDLLHTVSLQNLTANQTLISVNKANTTNYAYLIKLESTYDQIYVYGTDAPSLNLNTLNHGYPAKLYGLSYGSVSGNQLPEEGYYIVFSSLPYLEFFAGTTVTQTSADLLKIYRINIELAKSAIAIDEHRLLGDSSSLLSQINTKLLSNLGTNSDIIASSDTGNFNLIQFVKRLLSIKFPDAISGKIPVTSINYLTGFNVVGRTTTGTFYEGSIPQSKSLVFQVTGNFIATNIIAQSRIGSVFSYETIDVYDVKKRDWVSSITEAGIYIVPNNAEMVKIGLTAIAGGTVSFDYILRDDNLVSYKQTSKQSYFDSFNVNVPSGSGAIFYDPTSDLKKLIFTNNSTNTVFFDFTSSVSSSIYIFKLEPGDTFIDEGENINKDATYFAIANNATSAVRVARWT